MYPDLLCDSYSSVSSVHSRGLFYNLADKNVLQLFVCPLMYFTFSPVLCGEPVVTDNTVSVARSNHEDSWSPTSDKVNKRNILFHLGFVTASQ